jgi:hypothetical protein
MQPRAPGRPARANEKALAHRPDPDSVNVGYDTVAAGVPRSTAEVCRGRRRVAGPTPTLGLWLGGVPDRTGT